MNYRQFAIAWLQGRPRFCQVGLWSLTFSVIAITLAIFYIAVSQGADTVAALPRWLWWSIILYTANALGICVWLVRALASNQTPRHPSLD
jgi:uncharacterized membrane protein